MRPMPSLSSTSAGCPSGCTSAVRRCVTIHATDDEIASLRRLFSDFEGGELQARIDEYSDRNIQFHQKILELSRCQLLKDTAESLFLHMRGIRARTIGEDDRAAKSIIDHIHIIEALEARDTDLVEKLAREHALNLAAHVEQHVDYLD